MDTGWMLKVLEDFTYESQKKAMQTKLQKLINAHQQYIQQPNDNKKNGFDVIRAEISEVLQDSASNSYTPSVAKIANDLGLYNLMGQKLLDAIEIRLVNSMPQEAQPALQEMYKEMTTKQQHVSQIMAGMRGLNLSKAEIPEGQVQLNYIIPNNYKNEDYKAFIKANKEMLYVIDTMNHVVGHGASETKIVSTRSGSLLMALISNIDTIQTLLDVIKTILEITTITGTAVIAIKKIQESGFSREVVDAAIEDKEKIFDRKIDDLKAELQEKYEKNNSGADNQNFHIQINNSVNTIINAHKDGIQVEAISGPKNENMEESSNEKENKINELTVAINRLAQDVEAMKSLPHKPVEIDDEEEE